MNGKVKQVAGTAKQTGHCVPHKSPFPEQRRKDADQAAQHSRDMQRINKLSENGMKK